MLYHWVGISSSVSRILWGIFAAMARTVARPAGAVQGRVAQQRRPRHCYGSTMELDKVRYVLLTTRKRNVPTDTQVPEDSLKSSVTRPSKIRPFAGS